MRDLHAAQPIASMLAMTNESFCDWLQFYALILLLRTSLAFAVEITLVANIICLKSKYVQIGSSQILAENIQIHYGQM